MKGGFDLRVAPDGAVVTLGASEAFYDKQVRVFSPTGQQTSSWSVPDRSTDGLAMQGGDIALVWGGAGSLQKTVVGTFSRTGQMLSSVEPFGPADQQSDLDPDPSDLDIDRRGDRYLTIASNWSPTVQRFSSAGPRIAAWGSEGSGPGQFGTFTAEVASNGSGSVYVTDPANDRVEQFTDTGTFVRSWGQTGTGPGQFVNPISIAVGPGGDVWVSDDVDEPRRIQRFSADGAFKEQVTIPKVVPKDSSQLFDIYPVSGIDFDGAGRLYALTGKVQVEGQVHVLTSSAGGSPAPGGSGGSKGAAAPALRSTALRLKRGRIAVRLRCKGSAPCKGTLRVKKGTTVLGSRSYTIAAGKSATVTVVATRVGRRSLARARKHKVAVVLAPAGGTSVARPATVRR